MDYQYVTVMFRHSIFGIAAFFSVLLALVPNLLWLVAWCVGLLEWSPAHLMFNECDGRYNHDGRMLYVNARTYNWVSLWTTSKEGPGAFRIKIA